MLPEHFYFTGAGWLGFFICIPIALSLAGLIYWLLLRRIPVKWLRFGLLGILSLTLVTMPLWEALSTSYEAEKLCKEQGGLHVYKTVETDGFVGSSSIKYWNKYGFAYLEHGQYYENGRFSGEKYHYTMQESNERKEKIDEFKSTYQFLQKSNRINKKIKKTRYWTRNISTDEVLGELVNFGIYPSYFDRLLLGLLGGSHGWICGNEAPKGEGSYNQGKRKYVYNPTHLMKETLKPKNNIKGEIQ